MGNQSRSSLLGILVVGAVLCVALAGLGSVLSAVYAANPGVHEMYGIVESVGVREQPPTIVVRSPQGTPNEVVVGAIITPTSTLLRGKKRIGLDQIRSGDMVTVKYMKTREGLTARSIVLHRK